MKNSVQLAWGLFGASTVGMFIFAALYLLNPKQMESTHGTTRAVTNTLTTVTTNEVEKIVKVPAEIPEDYLTGWKLFTNMSNASFVKMDEALFKMEDVRVIYNLDAGAKQVVTEDEVKAKFELTLRRNNVPMNPKSKNVILLTVNGFFGDNDYMKDIFCYFVNCSVDENQWLLRGQDWHRAQVILWMKGLTYGNVGRAKAGEATIHEVEKCADLFANDYLSANPKPK